MPFKKNNYKQILDYHDNESRTRPDIIPVTLTETKNHIQIADLYKRDLKYRLTKNTKPKNSNYKRIPRSLDQRINQIQ